jgi:hypothetical protein
MGLSNQQIERYARQIIVPQVGGVAQERLLSARLMIAGTASDLASVLAYMVGAGVGETQLQLPASDEAARDSLIMGAMQLNPEVAIKPRAASAAGVNLVLAISSDSESLELIASSPQLCAEAPLIFCRLDEPASIAILTCPPPCLFCADADLLAHVQRRSDNAGFVSMIAAAEAFKTLAGAAPTAAPMLLQFKGFTCATRQLRQKALVANCQCSKATGR